MGNLEVSETKLINENQAKMDYYPELPLSARDSDNTETSTQVSRNTSKKKNISISQTEQVTSQEKDALGIIQKHNRQYEDKDLIEQCLLKHFFMRSLEKQARYEIIKEMTLCGVHEGKTIFTQGTPGTFFYILKKGRAALIINGEKKKTFLPGESFGELALLHCAPRTGTVIAETECSLWVLGRKNFRKIVEHISKLNFEENKTFIQSIPILAHMDHYQKTLLCVNLIKETFEAGKNIVKAGEPAHCIYIIKEGEVNCMKDDKIIRTLTKGHNFGERSILIDSTRTMDVFAKTNCVCYSVSITTLKYIVGEKYRTLLYLNFIKNSIMNSKHFKRFNRYLIDHIFSLFEAVNLGKDGIAFKKGYTKSENIVIIIDGHLINGDTNEIVADRGSILFEDELLSGSQETTTYDLLPYPDCLLIKASTKQIMEKLGGSLYEIMEKSEITEALSQVNIFKNLPRKKLDMITQKIGVEKYKVDENIITEGETGNKLYIVKSGKIDITVKGKYIRTLNEMAYFGERALFVKEKRSATATAKTPVEVFTISQEDFMANIEENMKEHLMNRLYLQDNTIELDKLTFVEHLGSGNYGSVSKVKYSKNDFLYAIKGISMEQIYAEELFANLELEKSILLQIDHPFIMKLVKTLKNKNYVFFLMEYIDGKELFDVIRDIGLLNKQQTQFYGGSLLLAIEYLHERKFIYRDIKPENIMVCYKNGYLKLIDFGTAKRITDRTSTIIGTPHYMAPEVIIGGGYSFQVDIWSIAICMYEFVCGGVPFGESAEDPMEVYLAIINTKLTFPQFCKEREFKQLMVMMLTKNPMHRLTKINQIKNHMYFQDFNWEELMNMNMKPAYLPKEPNADKPNEYEHMKGAMFTDFVEKCYKKYPGKVGPPPRRDPNIDPGVWYEKF